MTTKAETDLALYCPAVSFDIPIRTVSEANRASSEHWRKRWSRAKAQRTTAALLMKSRWVNVEAYGGVVVDLIRCAPGKLDDDNLAGSMKHIRDGIADALGIDDGSPMYRWQYAQPKTKRGVYMVRVVIRPMCSEAA